MAFTVVADFELLSLGVPKDNWPQFVLFSEREGLWEMDLMLPGPGHPGLFQKAAILFTKASRNVFSTVFAPGAGIVELNTRSHIVISQQDDGTVSLFANGKTLAIDPNSATSVPLVGVEEINLAFALASRRMSVDPKVRIRDVRTYVVAFTAEHAAADMQKPIPGWVSRLTPPGEGLFALLILGLILIAFTRTK